MFDDDVGFRGAELIEFVVTRENGAGMKSAVLGGLDVMLHVADEQRFASIEIVVGKDVVDFLSLVQNASVGFFKKPTKARGALLNSEVIVRNCAEKEGADFVCGAEFQKVAGVRQGADGGLDLAEAGVKPGLQLRHWDVRREFVVKDREWQAELGAELFESEFGAVGLGENVIGGLPDCREVIHQSPRPIEYYIANHGRDVSRGGLAGNRIARLFGCPSARHVGHLSWLIGQI